MNLRLLLAALSGVALMSFSCSSPEKPNVLFIAIDDLNSCIEGMDGETYVHTPNINSLSSKGVLFTNAHCAAPACNPSRAALITGLAPATTGVYQNRQDWRVNKLLANHVTIPHHFRNNGYKVLGGGKIYHAHTLSKWGYEGFLDPRPWDEYFPSKESQLPQEVKPDFFPYSTIKSFYGGHFDWAPLDIETDKMADAKTVSWAVDHLSAKHDKPLFLAVGIYRPHVPWWTPKSYFDMHPLDEVELPEIVEGDLDDVPAAGQKFARRHWQKWIIENDKWEEAVQAYNASVSFADDMVGRLLKALEEGPLAENTIVVLWTDHGYHLGQKEHWEKFALWEQTTRVPLIIAAPGNLKAGRIQAGRLCNQPASLLDVYPTLCELCGIPAKVDLDGESLVPLLKDPKMQTGRNVVITHGRRNHAVRSEKWRYIRYADGSEELYDMEKDPKNFTNLAGLGEYLGTKEILARGLPDLDADPDPPRLTDTKKK